MTRARNGAAPVAPAGILWHVIPDDDDCGPSKTFPPCRDGDKLLARVNGEAIEVTVDRRHGVGFIGPDGESLDPRSIDAIALRPARSSRSGKHVADRLRVNLPASPEEVAQFRAAAEEEGLPLAQWLLEAARAYALIAKRPDGELTDADWRKVVRG